VRFHLQIVADTPGTHASLTTRLGRSLLFLRNNLWLWPLLAVFVFLFTGLLFRSSLHRTSENLTRSQLQTLLASERRALVHWLGEQEANARLIAADSEFLAGVETLIARPDLNSLPAHLLAETEEVKALQDTFKAVPRNLGYPDFVVLDSSFRIIGGSFPELLTQVVPPESVSQFSEVFKGESHVTTPAVSRLLLPDGQGGLRAGLPTMFVVVPIQRADLTLIAALACRMDPRKEFSDMLSQSRFGKSGEIYAFNRDGYLVSESRFESELKDLGLLPDTPTATSILQLRLLDPGVDLRSGRPVSSRDSLPLTRMASQATRGEIGADVQGYRDYRGVLVAGAWTWINGYNFGLAAKIDLEEIRRPFVILRHASLLNLGLLGLSALGLAGFTAVVNRLQQQLRRAALEARKLGQYAIEEEIGHGFNGRVFRARHARLRRPVAVKLLNTDRTNPGTIARFEREVQATCGLTHPNTIVVYDYGRTPEDIFYYAMEYLDGLSLNTLVERFGPQPEGRTIWILRQVCGSLAEAHQRGLVHRDIKPANLFLTRRGGLADFVKVLDFGLVKAIDPNTDLARTVAESLIGSPHFLSPESINNPNQIDARSDLYSLGAVGYFLLTGQPVFEAGDLTEVLVGHSDRTPIPPSERRGSPIDRPLEQLILQCLEKNPGLRPSNALTLEQALLRCPSVARWSQTDANHWWEEHLNSEQTER